jgi:hypothetical protein
LLRIIMVAFMASTIAEVGFRSILAQNGITIGGPALLSARGLGSLVSALLTSGVIASVVGGLFYIFRRKSGDPYRGLLAAIVTVVALTLLEYLASGK